MGIMSHYIPLAAYILCFVAGLLAIFVRVEIGLAYFVLLIPFQNVIQKMHEFPLGNQVVDILVVSLFVAWLRSGRSEKGELFEKKSLDILAFSYIFVTFISLVWGSFYLDIEFPLDLSNERLKDWKNLALLPAFYLITVNNVKEPKWMKFILAMALFSVLLTDLGFYREFRWYKQWHYSHDMRVAGPFYYLGPNELGGFFAQYGVLSFGLFLFIRKKVSRILIGVVFLASSYCLMYSYSRAAYLALPIGMGVILLFRNKVLLIALGVLAVISVRFLPVSVIERVQMTTEVTEEEKSEGQSLDTSSEARFKYTEKAIDSFLGSPILGTGFRTFTILVGRDTHNNYAKILAESGIIGFGVYILLYWMSIKAGWRLYRRAEDDFMRGLGLGFLGCVIANMVLNTTHDCWSYINLMGLYWVILGLVARYNIMVEGESKGNGAISGNTYESETSGKKTEFSQRYLRE